VGPPAALSTTCPGPRPTPFKKQRNPYPPKGRRCLIFPSPPNKEYAAGMLKRWWPHSPQGDKDKAITVASCIAVQTLRIRKSAKIRNCSNPRITEGGV